MTATVVYHDVPNEIREAINPHVDKWLPALPRWVANVTVVFVPEDEDSSLSTVVRPEYRSLTLRVHPGWLNHRERDNRSADVLHEFLHAPLEMARDVFHNTVHAAVDDTDPLFSFVREEYRKALECGVNDLEDIVLRLTA